MALALWSPGAEVYLCLNVQVCSDVVVLLAGSSRQAETTVQQLMAPPEAPTSIQGEKAAVAALPDNAAGVEVLAASVADPYLLLHLSNGSAALLKGSLESGAPHVLPVHLISAINFSLLYVCLDKQYAEPKCMVYALPSSVWCSRA